MRVLREDSETKEVLPVSFITDMMSKSWDEVGYLKEASAAIKETYQNTNKVEELMQDLMDAYLVFIGQLELYLSKEENIETDVNESDKIDDNQETPVSEDDEDVEDVDEADTPKPADAVLPEAELEIAPVQKPIEHTPSADEFEFFVDFDEPDMSQPAMTDDDLYPEETKHRLNS